MKYKNYKSAIHNFTHSFISIDFIKSHRYAVNVLIDLYKLNLEAKASFDFFNLSILPLEANTERANELMGHYNGWLPDHFEKHNCDISKLEKIETTVWIDFEIGFTPEGINDSIQIEVNALTIWQADGRAEKEIYINQSEMLRKTYLEFGIPELK